MRKSILLFVLFTLTSIPPVAFCTGWISGNGTHYFGGRQSADDWCVCFGEGYDERSNYRHEW